MAVRLFLCCLDSPLAALCPYGRSLRVRLMGADVLLFRFLLLGFLTAAIFVILHDFRVLGVIQSKIRHEKDANTPVFSILLLGMAEDEA